MSRQGTMARRAEANDAVKAALAGPGDHLGDVVWVSFGSVKARRSDIRAAFVAQGLPEALAPSDPTPDAAFGWATASIRKRDDGVFVRRVDAQRRGSDVMIVQQVPGQSKLDTFITLGRLGLDLANRPTAIKGADWNNAADEVTAAIEREFDLRIEHADTAELSASVIASILSWCGGIRLRDRGNVYWAHHAGRAEIRALAAVVEKFGTSNLAVLPVHDTAIWTCSTHGSEISSAAGNCSVCGRALVQTREAHRAVQRAAADSFTAELAEIEAQLAEFSKSDKVRASTIEHRLEAFADLRDRVELYSDVLDNKKSALLARLDKAKDAARALIAEGDAT